MLTSEIAHPPIVSREEWLSKRLSLLEKEKALTKQYDRNNAERRRLPMVKIEKDYIFEGPNGKTPFIDLFEGKHQLIVYHFMYGPDDAKPCRGCTGFVNALGDLSQLGERNTAFTLISRGPFPKLEAVKKEKGWKVAWYSSLGSDFNYDMHVSMDESKAPAQYNYKDREQLLANGWKELKGEMPGMSIFFQIDGDIFHTYSTFGRGVELCTDTYAMLDLTPYGRQEDFEDSPAGWPQKPTYG